ADVDAHAQGTEAAGPEELDVAGAEGLDRARGDVHAEVVGGPSAAAAGDDDVAVVAEDLHAGLQTDAPGVVGGGRAAGSADRAAAPARCGDRDGPRDVDAETSGARAMALADDLDVAAARGDRGCAVAGGRPGHEDAGVVIVCGAAGAGDGDVAGPVGFDGA